MIDPCRGNVVIRPALLFVMTPTGDDEKHVRPGLHRCRQGHAERAQEEGRIYAQGFTPDWRGKTAGCIPRFRGPLGFVFD